MKIKIVPITIPVGQLGSGNIPEVPESYDDYTPYSPLQDFITKRLDELEAKDPETAYVAKVDLNGRTFYYVSPNSSHYSDIGYHIKRSGVITNGCICEITKSAMPNSPLLFNSTHPLYRPADTENEELKYYTSLHSIYARTREELQQALMWISYYMTFYKSTASSHLVRKFYDGDEPPTTPAEGFPPKAYIEEVNYARVVNLFDKKEYMVFDHYLVDRIKKTFKEELGIEISGEKPYMEIGGGGGGTTEEQKAEIDKYFQQQTQGFKQKVENFFNTTEGFNTIATALYQHKHAQGVIDSVISEIGRRKEEIILENILGDKYIREVAKEVLKVLDINGKNINLNVTDATITLANKDGVVPLKWNYNKEKGVYETDVDLSGVYTIELLPKKGQ